MCCKDSLQSCAHSAHSGVFIAGKTSSHTPCQKEGLDCWTTESLLKGTLNCCADDIGKPQCCKETLIRYMHAGQTYPKNKQTAF